MGDSMQHRNDSPSEKHGFVIHVISFPLAVAYLIWALVPENTLHAWNITYYPNKSWVTLVPTYMLCIFVAVPLLYAACNILSAPKSNSLHSIGGDKFSREGRIKQNKGGIFGSTDSSKVPEIFDIDVSIINRHIYNSQKDPDTVDDLK